MAKHGGVKDSGEYFAIDPISRKIIVPHIHKSIGVVGDHNSEQITFKCPQITDGHDISQCESRYVTWVNVDGERGHDKLQIKQVDQGEEGMLYLLWTIRNGLTVAKGIVQFSIHFEDTDDNGNISYRWSTATCKDCEILDSINSALGAYEAIYVAGNKLVIQDYTLVKDKTLKLETNGIVPEGTLKIEANGKYPVGKYAEVDVVVDPEAPVITVTDKGLITATANGVSSNKILRSEFDSDFLPSNIKKDVEIFGLKGTYEPEKPKLEDVVSLVTGTISIVQNKTIPVDLQVDYSGYPKGLDKIDLESYQLIVDGSTFTTKFVKGLPIIIRALNQESREDIGNVAMTISTGTDLILESATANMSHFVIKPIEDNFVIEMVLEKG